MLFLLHICIWQSEAVTEVLLELLNKLFLPVADLLHAAEEEAENFWLLSPLKTTDEVAVIYCRATEDVYAKVLKEFRQSS